MILFLQIAVIIAASRLCGWLVRRWLRQPPVIGEMIAGVLLGPSLLGLLAPEVSQFLFPSESRPVLYAVAQLGIGLYMFLVGLDFRGEHLRTHAPAAVAVSVSGLVVPFAVAVLGAPWLLGVPGLFGDGVSRMDATLFLGTAIAITAFPVLARIIEDRGITGSLVGTLAISAAAFQDALAWCVLAIVLASVGGGTHLVMAAAIGGIAFAAFLLLIGPRLLSPLGRMAERQRASGQGLGAGVLAAMLSFFAASAWISDYIGLHVVFGGFLAGAVVPRGVLADRLRELLAPFTVTFLLPLFFTFSGLNTSLDLVDTAELLVIAAVVLVASIFAKFVACWAAARLSGLGNRAALGIGALMNARGLTELVILNIGLSAGIIAPALFSMLVLMAIVTTLMAAPLFDAVYGRRSPNP